MARLNASLDTILAAMQPQIDPEVYVFTSAPAVPEGVDAFAIIREHESLTLIVPEREQQRLALAGDYRCRRIDPGIDTALDGIGFLARISAALAAEGIALNPIAANRRDHLFVPHDRADDALVVMNNLARSARARCEDGLWQFAPDIWIVEGETVPFYTMPYPTRMTVIRLADGGLWLHSPIRYSTQLSVRLAALGDVRYLVAPNPLHHLFIAAWAKAYPLAACFGAPGVQAKLPGLVLAPLADTSLPWRDEIDCMLFEGSPLMQEAVFHHRASHTLIVTDLIENFDPATLSLKNRLLARLAGVLAPRGRTPLDWRLSFFGAGRARAAHCARLIESWSPDRLVMAHGELIHTGAAEFLDHAFAYFTRGQPP
jgi:hypothetical protein